MYQDAYSSQQTSTSDIEEHRSKCNAKEEITKDQTASIRQLKAKDNMPLFESPPERVVLCLRRSPCIRMRMIPEFAQFDKIAQSAYE